MTLENIQNQGALVAGNDRQGVAFWGVRAMSAASEIRGKVSQAVAAQTAGDIDGALRYMRNARTGAHEVIPRPMQACILAFTFHSRASLLSRT